MMPHAPLLSDGDEREAVRQLMLLDPCSAWRADLADAGLPEPMDEALADQWLLWLQIATVFDRLRSLPARARAAYARSTGPLWETAERITGATRFARVGEVMATWRGAAPELAGFRELLWAVEQGEAEGALRVSISALTRLRGLLSHRDIRPAYAGAQLARALRTAGFLAMSRYEFELSRLAASHAADSWLRWRTELGLAVLHQSSGNYPAARDAFFEVTAKATDHRDILVAAHIGTVSAALTLGRFDEAISHGWEAMRLATGESEEDIEVLAMMADIALEVGHFDLALQACEYGLTLRPKRRRRYFFERGAVVSASMLGQPSIAMSHAAALERSASTTTNPWERSFSNLVLGKVYAQHGQEQRGQSFLGDALSIAHRHGFHEIEWKAAQSLSELLRRKAQLADEAQQVRHQELEPASQITLARIVATHASSWRSSQASGRLALASNVKR